LGGLDNLARISDAQKSFATNDADDIRKRIHDLKKRRHRLACSRSEEAALNERLTLMQQQQEKVFGWLAENEEAMTVLDRVMAGIAEMNTVQSASMKMEDAMKELATLAARARSYGSD